MKIILDILLHASILEVFFYGVLLNFSLYFFSIILYHFLSHSPNKKTFGNEQKLLKKDVFLSLFTVICNTIVFVLGVFLWQQDFIIIKEQIFLYWIPEILLFTLIMDFLMYFFHRLVHFLKGLARIHQRHHQHESTNVLSLFVLHPIEAIGFGLTMLGVMYVISFSAISIAFYLIFNLIWGTIGHLHHSVLPSSWLKRAKKWYICTSEFHYTHHQNLGFNFGFYTSVWDTIFLTLHPVSKNIQ